MSTTLMIVLGMLICLLGGGFMFFIYNNCRFILHMHRDDGTKTLALIIAAFFAGVFITLGATVLTLSVKQMKIETVEDQCIKHQICYELVETTAEYTNYTEQEVFDFFLIVSDSMEAWDAIYLLDNTLTYEEINAIMEISAMKQAR